MDNFAHKKRILEENNKRKKENAILRHKYIEHKKYVSYINKCLEKLIIYYYPTNKKMRYGINTDGGYVIADLDTIYDCYISCGVSNEESFSKDFIEKQQMTKQNSFAYDGTIENYPYQYTNEITFVRKNIGQFNTNTTTNLEDLFSRYNNIFIKMDIEGGEYEWFKSLTTEKLDKISQLVIEFHGLTNDEFDTRQNKINCFSLFSSTHYPIHIHGNNCGPINDNIPQVIEVTYIHKKFIQNPTYNTVPLPIKDLDYPNNTNIQDYHLTFKPFVF